MGFHHHAVGGLRELDQAFLRRVDKQRRSSDIQKKVSSAQLIMQDGRALSNKKLKGKLDPESLVAVPVRPGDSCFSGRR